MFLAFETLYEGHVGSILNNTLFSTSKKICGTYYEIVEKKLCICIQKIEMTKISIIFSIFDNIITQFSSFFDNNSDFSFPFFHIIYSKLYSTQQSTRMF